MSEDGISPGSYTTARWAKFNPALTEDGHRVPCVINQGCYFQAGRWAGGKVALTMAGSALHPNIALPVPAKYVSEPIGVGWIHDASTDLYYTALIGSDPADASNGLLVVQASGMVLATGDVVLLSLNYETATSSASGQNAKVPPPATP